MRIAHVNLARGFRGGERQTELLVRALAEHGLEQWLVSRGDSPLRDRLRGVPRLRLRRVSHQLTGHRFAGGVDLLHSHETKAGHWAWLHHRLRGVPYVLTRRVPQRVHDTWLNRRIYRDAACVVAISRVIEEGLRAHGWGPVVRIPSALAHLPVDARHVARLRRRHAHRFVIGHVGAVVDRHKGQRILLEAARQLRDELPAALFLFVGDGPDLSRLREESAAMDNVEWMGNRDDPGDHLSAMDVFAFPSRSEGLGSTLLDAMDLGVPVVAADVGGIPDIVEHGRTGLLVPPNDAAALASAIRRLHDDARLRARLATAARERLSQYTPAAMARRYLAVYEAVLRGDPVAPPGEPVIR